MEFHFCWPILILFTRPLMFFLPFFLACPFFFLLPPDSFSRSLHLTYPPILWAAIKWHEIFCCSAIQNFYQAVYDSASFSFLFFFAQPLHVNALRRTDLKNRQYCLAFMRTRSAVTEICFDSSCWLIYVIYCSWSFFFGQIAWLFIIREKFEFIQTNKRPSTFFSISTRCTQFILFFRRYFLSG